MGRTKENPRYHVISCRVADDELAAIAAHVPVATRCDFFRQAIKEKLEREQGEESHKPAL